jgi:adenine nucleotide transporter 17
MKQSNTLTRVTKKEKARSYYAALGPSLFLSVNPGLQYAIFDQVKNFMTKKRPGKALAAMEAFVLGAFSKCVATMVTYPAIRGKVICQSVHGAKYNGLLDAMSKIIDAEGAGGLYKGLPQQLTKTVLSAAIGLMLKEKISQAERTFAAMLLKSAAAAPK